MSNSFSISGAPKFTNVTTEAALKTAISTAKAGEVITLTAVVPGFSLSISAPKASPGICIALPATQQVALTLDGKNLNTEIVGGYLTNHPETYASGAGSDYSVKMGSASHFAIRGVTYGLSRHCTTGSRATDFVVEDVLCEWPENDFFQIAACSRFEIIRPFARNMVKGQKMRWFSDGQQPVDGASASGSGTAPVFWVDTGHNDGCQIRSDANATNTPGNGTTTALPSTDFRLDGLDMHVLGGGVVHYDYNPYSNSVGSGGLGLPSMERGIVENCNMRTVDIGTVNIQGNDLVVRNNTGGQHPLEASTSNVTMAVKRLPSNASSRVRGGGNSLVVTRGDAPFFSASAGVDMAAPENGDADVVPPTPPAFGRRRLPWAPAVTRPAFAAYEQAPKIIIAPQVCWAIGNTPYYSDGSNPVAPPLNAYLTVGLGRTMGYENSTGEFRWTIDGQVVGTGRVYRHTDPANAGKTLYGETRRTNSFGTGQWKQSIGVVLGS